jgi:hypothetical protein
MEIVLEKGKCINIELSYKIVKNTVAHTQTTADLRGAIQTLV